MASEVNLSFLAKNTHGFSGADLTEICQWAAKLAIRASIDADIWAAKREVEDAKMEDDSKEAEDPVPQITRLAFIVITSL